MAIIETMVLGLKYAYLNRQRATVITDVLKYTAEYVTERAPWYGHD